MTEDAEAHAKNMEKYIQTLKDRQDSLNNDLKHFSALHHNIISENLLKHVGKDYKVLDKKHKNFNKKVIDNLAKGIKDSYVKEAKNVLKEGLSDEERDKWIKTLYNVNEEDIRNSIDADFDIDVYKKDVIDPHAKNWYAMHSGNVSSHIKEDDISKLVKYIGADKYMKGHEENINSAAYLPWLTQIILNAKKDDESKKWSVSKDTVQAINNEVAKAKIPYHAGPWMKKD